MPVDSFKFLPRLIATFYQLTEREPEYPIPWTPLSKPLSACKFGLVTSAGFYCKDVDPPFDVAREQQEPTWGDPTYRAIPTAVPAHALAVSHLHLNSTDMEQDANIVLPIQRFQALVAADEIGSLAVHHYSFMGFQGFPPNASLWRERYAPEVAAKFRAEDVDCVLLTPT